MLKTALKGLFKYLIFFTVVFFFIQAGANAGTGTEKSTAADVRAGVPADIRVPKNPKDLCSRAEYVNLEWWKRFNDEVLVELIVYALNNNYNLRSLELKLFETYQAKNIEVSKEFPSLSVGANYLGLKIPRTAIPFQGFRDNAFSLPFILNWEIDLFGKRKNKIDIEKENFKGAYYEELGAAIALASEIGTDYFNILNLDEQIKIQNKILKNRKEALRRAENRYNAGVLGVGDLNDIKKMYEYETIVLNDYRKQREKFLLNLKYLAGEGALENDIFDSLSRGASFCGTLGGDILNTEFSGGIPEFINSSVTAYRPDILKKEAELKKAKINVTLARKEFLPNINVFGVLMFSTLTPNFGWDGAVANMVAGAVQNIFSGGKRVFNLKQKKTAFKRAFLEYLDADSKAVAEINEALYYLKTDNESYLANLKSLDFEEDNFVRVSNSFGAGVLGVLDVLDKENEFLYQKSKVLNSKTQKIIDLITLYKACGGKL